VALGAGWISFGHTRALLLTLGESDRGAVLGALAVDGVLVASGLVLFREASALALASAPECTPVAQVHSGALGDERAPSAPGSAPAPAPGAPRAHLVAALAESASAARVHSTALVSAPGERTPSAPASAARVHLQDADLLERLRVHLREHPDRASGRAVASALGVGQTKARALLAQVQS